MTMSIWWKTNNTDFPWAKKLSKVRTQEIQEVKKY